MEREQLEREKEEAKQELETIEKLKQEELLIQQRMEEHQKVGAHVFLVTQTGK